MRSVAVTQEEQCAGYSNVLGLCALYRPYLLMRDLPLRSVPAQASSDVVFKHC